MIAREKPRWRVPLVIATASCLLYSGCTSSTEEPGWAGTIEERDGVTRVSNPSEGLWAGEEDAGLRLELEQVFGVAAEPGDAILAFITGLAVDGDGNVYVLDRGASALVAFAPDGEVLWRREGEGEGPGEFLGANEMVWDGADHLYVSNQSGGRLDVWSLSGEFVETQRVADFDLGQAYVVGVLAPDVPVLRQSARGRYGVRIVTLQRGDPWTLGSDFFVPAGPELEEGAFGFGVGVRVFEESIWVGHRIEYLLREFDAEGTQLRAITREFPDLIPPFVYRGTGWFLGEFQAPMRLDDGRLLVPVAWSTNVENAEDFRRKLDKARAEGSGFDVALDSALDLYDPGGRYLTSLAWEGMFPETGRPALVGRDGRLYTIVYEADFPQVRRYRVEILPPG